MASNPLCTALEMGEYLRAWCCCTPTNGMQYWIWSARRLSLRLERRLFTEGYGRSAKWKVCQRQLPGFENTVCARLDEVQKGSAGS